MKELLHMRVFELEKDRYRLPRSTSTTLEQYVLQELEDGYVITDMTNFGIEKLRVTSYYSPDSAKKQIEAGSMVSALANAKAEEV